MLPSDEYTRRLAAREAQVAAVGNLHARIGTARVSLGLATLLAAWWSLQSDAFALSWLLLPCGAFVGLVIFHFYVRRSRGRAQRAVAFYRAGLARVEDRWAGSGRQGARFDDPRHVYAADLDLFGSGSLFELLCVVRTRMGEERLAAWLKFPAPLEVIRERQLNVADLASRLDLREDLAVMGEHAEIGVQPTALVEWAETPNRLENRWVRVAGLVLPVAAVAAVTYWQVTGIRWPFLLVVLIEIGVLYLLRKPIGEALQGTENAFEDLRLFSALLMRIEREPFTAPPLRALLATLSSGASKASLIMGRLGTIVNFAGARRNQIIALLAVPLLYTLHAARAVERWRSSYGHVARSWVNVMGEFEALLSLGAYRFEHPDDPFPEFVTGPGSFAARELGHPLIPAARRVSNDLTLDGTTRILLVSGSNMSGKSTLLRTVGINTVLAMAGAPVRARHLSLTPLQVGASIRINDSLHAGSSRFHAEITRLRQIFDLTANDPPLLFLLDELLQGTNSQDRRSGAEGVVRAFVARGATGLISTHDLALTDISGLAAGALRNVHFQDELGSGHMTFDFKLRDGIVTKSNALELMRAIGLEV